MSNNKFAKQSIKKLIRKDSKVYIALLATPFCRSKFKVSNVPF